MNYVFANPDKVMVGVRGEVGNRLFLLQVREGRRLVIVKCEKQQLAALAEWLAQVDRRHRDDRAICPMTSLSSPSTSRTSSPATSRSPSTKRHQTIEVTIESLEEDRRLSWS